MVDKHISKMYNHGIIRKEICIMNENTLKKSTHFISVIFNVASIIAIIVDIGAVLLLGGTLLSQIMRPGYLAKQMINAEMELVFSEWVVLLVCFIIKCSCIFLAIRYSKKLFYCISKQESPFTANTTKCINIIGVEVMAIILRLDRVMADRKISLKDLAEQVGIANINLSKIKTGKVSAIRFSTLNAICEVLDCQPGDILEYVEDEDDECT